MEQLGDALPQRVTRAPQDHDADRPRDAEVQSLCGAGRFVPTSADRYDQIEQIGRDLGLITGG